MVAGCDRRYHAWLALAARTGRGEQKVKANSHMQNEEQVTIKTGLLSLTGFFGFGC
jgi:hypothetical protein